MDTLSSDFAGKEFGYYDPDVAIAMIKTIHIGTINVDSRKVFY